MYHLVDNYISSLQARSPHTREAYKYALDDFFKTAVDSGLGSIDEHAIQLYINKLAQKNTPATVRQRFCALKAFLHHSGLDANVNLKRVLVPTMSPKDRDIPGDVEMEMYEKHVKARCKNPAMKTLLLILPHTGLRIAEACGDRETRQGGLHRQDIQLRGGQYEIKVTGKRGRVRYIPLNTESIAILLPYARSCNVTSTSKLFTFTHSAVKKKLKRIGARIGFSGLSPHVFRHVFISNLIADGVDMRTVQKLAGHSNASTTLGYAHTTPERMRDAVERLVRRQE